MTKQKLLAEAKALRELHLSDSLWYSTANY